MLAGALTVGELRAALSASDAAVRRLAELPAAVQVCVLKPQWLAALSVPRLSPAACAAVDAVCAGRRLQGVSVCMVYAWCMHGVCMVYAVV